LARALAGVIALLLILGVDMYGQQQGPATSVTARPISPDVITGVWDYNDSLSLDAATGRPERAPRSATQRTLGAAAAANPPDRTTTSSGRTGGSGNPGAGGNGGPDGRDSFGEARRAMAAIIAAERRTYVRDLLEVPELLKIKASTGEVVIGDDLGRERTYTTDGKLQKYQLSAARYEARGSWSDTYFRKDIEGSNNFKMSETYFVSEDGRRLFVIIRIGDPRKPETLAGVNRVYDRVGSF
jgi:hypothetical protein